MTTLFNGFYAVPPGKVASIVTFLEMTEQAPQRPSALPDGVSFQTVDADTAWFRDIFERVGSREWLWYGRRKLDDPALKAVLDDPDVEHYTLRLNGRDEALIELDFRTDGTCELVYFGLTRALIGTGSGRYMMNVAIDRAWSRPIRRFIVDTCTFDSPQALDFYRRSGFVPVRQEVRIDDDPRLSGILSRDAAPSVPVFST